MGTKNNPGKYACYDKAKPDEPVFVLLARDPAAPTLVNMWAALKALDEGGSEKVKEAMECAHQMKAWAEGATSQPSKGAGWVDLAAQGLEVSALKGFDEPTWENMLSKIMLAITELDEASDAYHGRHDALVGEELADTAIRVTGIMESLWKGSWSALFISADPNVTFEGALWPAVAELSKAAEAWRKGETDRVRSKLQRAFGVVQGVALREGVDLRQEVASKIEKNRRRQHLHGKAVAV